MLKYFILFLTLSHVHSFLHPNHQVRQTTGVNWSKLFSTPFDRLAAGLEGLKHSAEQPKHATHTIPPQHKIPTPPHDMLPIYHELKQRPESSATLLFEPVRIFGKGHPGTGKTFNLYTPSSPHISAMTHMPL